MSRGSARLVPASILAAIALAVLSLAASSNDAPADAPADTKTDAQAGGASRAGVVVEQPEPAFGHTIGDVLVQRLRPADEDVALDFLSPLEESLPPGRIDRWLDRRAPAVVSDADGRRWLELSYQIVNAPEQVTVAALPGVALGLRGGASLRSDAWPIGIGPLTPGEASPTPADADRLPTLRPDRGPVPIDDRAARARLRNASFALGAVLLAWLVWWVWRRRRDRVRLPFARAAGVLGRRGDARAEAPDDADDAGHAVGYTAGHAAEYAAWRAVHHAFDETAGRTVLAATIPRLLAAAPWLAPFHDRIEAFYAASSARFFEQSAVRPEFDLDGFVRALARAEREVAS